MCIITLALEANAGEVGSFNNNATMRIKTVRILPDKSPVTTGESLHSL